MLILLNVGDGYMEGFFILFFIFLYTFEIFNNNYKIGILFKIKYTLKIA